MKFLRNLLPLRIIAMWLGIILISYYSEWNGDLLGLLLLIGVAINFHAYQIENDDSQFNQNTRDFFKIVNKFKRDWFYTVYYVD